MFFEQLIHQVPATQAVEFVDFLQQYESGGVDMGGQFGNFLSNG